MVCSNEHGEISWLADKKGFRRVSRTEYVALLGSRFHIRRWGSSYAPQMILLHGRMDVSATFQFLVDALSQEWSISALDWRGYGKSEWRNEKYWLYDDLADLDALVDYLSPFQPVHLVGHSYGGMVAGLYAAARPDRVALYVSIEGFGPRKLHVKNASREVGRWLDNLRQLNRKQRIYVDYEALALRLIEANSRLKMERARFLAEHIGRLRSDGHVELAVDPWRRFKNLPLSFYTTEFMESLFGQINIPALWIRATDSDYMRRVFEHQAAYKARFRKLRLGTEVIIKDSGHNVQHDQPKEAAEAVEHFIIANGKFG